MGLVFFGNERLANAVDETGIILRLLIEGGYEVTNLVVNRHEARSRKKRTDAVVKLAHEHGINVIDTWDEQHIIDIAKESEAAVLASFGRIIKDPVINTFKAGIINIHPSLLPEFRGSTPIESAILGGVEKTGVSIMALSSQLDAGNVYAQAEYEMRGDETKQELYETLSEMGAQMLIEQLPSILDGSNTGEPQDDHRATFTKMIIKSDGLIDWDQPAEVIEREIRAFAGWPGSKAVFNGLEVTITKARVHEGNAVAGEYDVIDKEIVVGCDKGLLVIEKLKPAGKGEMSSEGFLAGYEI